MIPFVGPSYDVKVRKADVQRSINLMPTPVESGAAGVFLKGVPGLKVFGVTESYLLQESGERINLEAGGSLLL